jgi:hypothetical protein
MVNLSLFFKKKIVSFNVADCHFAIFVALWGRKKYFWQAKV